MANKLMLVKNQITGVVANQAYAPLSATEDALIVAVVPGVDATSLGKAEDAVHGSGDTGVMALAVRKDSAGALAADGDYAPFLQDATGRIKTAAYGVADPQTPAVYRSGLVAADVMAVPGTVTCTKIAGAGLTAGAYVTKIVAINAHGRTTAKTGSATITTETTNLRINAAFAQVAGATHYDIYCTTAADPLFSGRVTEAQRAAGVLLSTLGAGSAVNSVDIDVIGTGLASGVSAAVNNAYVIPASPVVCTGYTYCDFLISCTRTGDAVAPALTVAPFLYNSRDTTYYQGQAYTHTFGGTTGLYNGMKFVVRVDVRGCSAVALLVQNIAGTGMSVVVDAMLS